MQFRGVRPHLAAKGISHGFSRVAPGTWGIFSSYGTDDPPKLLFVQRCQDSCLVNKKTSGSSSRFGRAIRTLLEVRWETQVPFPFATVILGFQSIFNRSQASSPFEAFNSACLSRCQSDGRPPAHMVHVPRTFSRVCTGDSDIPSSCEVKDEPAFKPLQGNPAFFRVRASQCPFHLRQQTQGPSPITIAEGSLILRCLWKVFISLHSKPGNQLSSQDHMGCTELSSSCCAVIGVPLDLRWGSKGLSGVA